MRDSPASAPVSGATAISVVHPGAGLRLRLWLGFLLVGCAGAAGTIGLLAWLAPADSLFNPRTFGIWPWSAAVLCIALAVGCALWLDHAIAFHLRGLCRAIAGGEPSELGELPAAAGWGELSLLTAQLQSLIARHREMSRASVDLEELRHRIRALRVAVEGRPGESLRPLEGPLGSLVEALNRRRAEEERIERESREDTQVLRRDLAGALADARASAEQAERGFVEATALLTTVRELQRLGGELQQGMSPGAPAGSAPLTPAVPAAEAQRRYREAAAAAIQELVTTSHESVERLAAGLAETQEVGAQVQILANRATLIALRVSLAGSAAAADPRDARVPGSPGITMPPEGLSHDLRTLATEVRAVTDRTAEHLAILDREVAAASDRMKGLRERVAARLDEAPPLPESAPDPGRGTPPSEAVLRLLERVREMIQDAAAKGERLSATGERASSAAERVVRLLEEEAGTLEALAQRLGAGGDERPGAALGAPADAGAPGAGQARPGDLRLLGPEEPDPLGHPRGTGGRVPPAPGRGDTRDAEESR
jgi:hypothetical protein